MHLGALLDHAHACVLLDLVARRRAG